MDDKKNKLKEDIQQEDDPKSSQASKSDKKIEEMKKEIEGLEDQLKRSVADYRNLEKRIEEEKKEFIKFANKDLLLKLFPAFDTLFLAEKYVKDEGLKLSIKKLTEVLKDAGVERIETLEYDFNPNLMECVDVVEGEENKVVDETRPGFTIYGKVLRPAQVKVGRKTDANASK